MFVLGFPLLLIPFAVYNIIAFITPGVSWTATVTTVHMMSGQDWVLTWEDIIVGFAILLLAVEIMKATRIGIRTIIDHMLAMALFIVMLVEFLLVERAGTSTFFLLLIISLVDVLVGFTVSVRRSQQKADRFRERVTARAAPASAIGRARHRPRSRLQARRDAGRASVGPA